MNFLLTYCTVEYDTGTIPYPTVFEGDRKEEFIPHDPCERWIKSQGRVFPVDSFFLFFFSFSFTLPSWSLAPPLALLALSRQSLCHGTTLQIDVPGMALCSAHAIHAQIK